MQRAREALRHRISVQFLADELVEGKVIEYLEGATHRSLAFLYQADEVRGRYHYEIGYVWSYREGRKWTPFSTFA